MAAKKKTFLARFEAMVAELKAHPKVKVFKVKIGKPASEASLVSAEKRVGPLPTDLRAFYAAHNGVFLEWGLRGRDYETTKPFSGPDYGSPPGCINLLPVKEAMSPSWLENSHINDVEEELQKRLFGKALQEAPKVPAVCVDNYSMYNHADLVFGPTPMVLVATDHGADITSSDFASFSVYLDATLALYGVDRYSKGFERSRGKPKKVTEWTKQVTLDKLIAALEKD